jgi:hypothetical protein
MISDPLFHRSFTAFLKIVDTESFDSMAFSTRGSLIEVTDETTIPEALWTPKT